MQHGIKIITEQLIEVDFSDPEGFLKGTTRATDAVKAALKLPGHSTTTQRVIGGPLSKDVSATAGLSLREEQVLTLIARGLSNKGIARELGIGDGTVKVHLKSVFRKIGVNDRINAALWVYERQTMQHSREEKIA